MAEPTKCPYCLSKQITTEKEYDSMVWAFSVGGALMVFSVAFPLLLWLGGIMVVASIGILFGKTDARCKKCFRVRLTPKD